MAATIVRRRALIALGLLAALSRGRSDDRAVAAPAVVAGVALM
jgi:hypothetical protein